MSSLDRLVGFGFVGRLKSLPEPRKILLMTPPNFLLYTVASMLAASSAFASIEIGTSYVGDVGNSADTTSYGGMGYGYRVGTYEVTNSQYVSFLNATAATDTHGLYNSSMNDSSHGGISQSGSSGSFSYSVKSGFGDKPVNYVSFWDAARFTNYLTTGGTESGVYNLGGVTAPTNNTITRDATAWNAGGVAIASEDEWYKAAYYDPTLNSGAGGYWDYAHQSDSITTADANYDNSVGTVTDVGTYSGDASYYGTFDQSGNVWEWNDAIVSSTARRLRSGALYDTGNSLQSLNQSANHPAGEHSSIGFRVSSLAPIPEPSSYAAMFGCLALGCATIRRKGRRTL
jgi:sulfatase modifying factor 1